MVQAYRQTPWRIETQRGVFILLLVIFAALLGWIYLRITIQAATTGLEVQKLDSDRTNLIREIAQDQAVLANLMSAKNMEKRALALGYTKVSGEKVVYMNIPGYTGRQSPSIAPATAKPIEPPLLKPVYTQSLWEWLFQGILKGAEPPGGYSP